MTPQEAFRFILASLKEAGVPEPASDAGWMLGHVLNRPALEARLDTDTLLTPAQERQLRELTQQRVSRIPLQYLLRTQSFLGRSFSVDERALIPRPETELLAELAMQSLHSGMRVLDLCCGTGCIAVSLALACPGAQVTASDLSADALSLARENAQRLGAQVEFVHGDLFAPLEGRTFDLLVSNPPYIPSDDCTALQKEVTFEPLMALDGGADGLDFYRRIACHAPRFLAPGGMLMMELGDGESGDVSCLLQQAGFRNIRILQDLQGLPRIIRADR